MYTLTRLKSSTFNRNRANKFDTTFTIVPEAIDSEIKCSYRVSNKITLVIDGELPKDAIKPITESSGSKFLKIKIDDDNTYKEFE